MADASPSKPSFAPIEVAGRRLTLLPEGPDRLRELIALIDGAQESLRLLYYIFEDDRSGRAVRDALVAAAERGVDVALLVDGFGSDASSEFFAPLSRTACRFCRFVPRFGRRYLLRNHQKLALADKKKVLVGGFNVADGYFGTVEEGAWRDLGLKVEGPGLECLADYFDSLFEWAKDPRSRIRTLRRMLGRHSKDDGQLHWLFGGPTRRLSPWARSVKRDMLRADRLDLIVAYFAPSRAMLRRICGVGARGEARVVTASKSDNSTTIGAARHTYWRMLKRGARVFEYQPTKLHTKLIVVDDVVHIGSANFDMRSLYLNLEMMLRVEDATFAAEMRRYVDHELADCLEITRESHARQRGWFNRMIWGVAYFLVATLDYSLTRRLNFGLEGRQRS